MVAFTTSSERLTETHFLPVGVFEDNALLVGLASSTRFAGSACLPRSDSMNLDDLAIEVASLADAETWEV